MALPGQVSHPEIIACAYAVHDRLSARLVEKVSGDCRGGRGTVRGRRSADTYRFTQEIQDVKNPVNPIQIKWAYIWNSIPDYVMV